MRTGRFIIFTPLSEQNTTMIQTRSVTLANAFEATDYFVQVGDEWHQVNIGAPCSDELHYWLIEHCAKPCAWIVTAHNPQAQQVDDTENTQREAALKACLDSQAHHYVATNSHAHNRDWPDEPGICVLDMDEGLARALALRFDQAAIVALPVCGPVQLVWSNPR